MKKLSLFIIILIGLSLTNFAQIQHGGTPISFQKNIHLSSSLPIISMPAIDLVQLQKEDLITDQHKDIPWRFGFNHEVNITPNNSGLWEDLGKENSVWRVKIVAKGALSINLTFDKYYLPKGAKLFIYSADKSEVLGAFTSENNKKTRDLGTTIIKSDAIIIEYYEPKNVAFSGEISISKVTQGYRNLLNSPNLEKGFGDSGSCNNNVVCPEGLPWDAEIRSVAAIIVNGNGNCTGALIYNACGEEKAYFLTANHCLSASVSTWVFRFNYQSPDCSPSVDGPTNQTVSGASLKASNGDSDFGLLELSSLPPASYNVYYAGWDNSDSIPTNQVGIHHPRGDVKKISFDNDPSSKTVWGSTNAACWNIGTWEDGTTEPASSGSPLFDQNHRIIGQLYGGTATCSNNIDDNYGRLGVSWANGGNSSNQLVDWLDACGSGVTTIDGFDPNQPTIANDANLYAISVPANGNASCQTDFTPLFLLKNKGTDTLTTLNVTYKIDSNPVIDTTWTGLLHTNEIDSFHLPNQTFSVGSHTFKVWTSAPNNLVDSNSINDTAMVAFEVLNPTTFPVAITEGFETNNFPPTNWDLTNLDNNTAWEISTLVSGFENSTSCVIFDAFTDDNSGTRDQLLLPYFDFSTIVGNVLLNFSVAYAPYNANFYDSLLVKASTDCGVTWNYLYRKGKLDLASNGGNYVNSKFAPTATEWRIDSIDLTSFIGEEKVLIAFENYNGYGNIIYLDDINIINNDPTQPPVAHFSNPTENCTNSPVTFSDASNNIPNQWQWDFPNGTPSTSSNQNPTITYNTAGTFAVNLTVTNANGSNATSSNIIINNAPSATAIVNDISGLGTSDGSIVLTNTDSTYSYIWSNGATTSGISNLTTGNYTVTISNTNNCKTSYHFDLLATGLEDVSKENSFILYPNPATKKITIQLNNITDATNIVVYNIIGELIYSQPVLEEKNIQLDFSDKAKGIYFVTLKTGTQTFNKKLIIK